MQENYDNGLNIMFKKSLDQHKLQLHTMLNKAAETFKQSGLPPTTYTLYGRPEIKILEKGGSFFRESKYMARYENFGLIKNKINNLLDQSQITLNAHKVELNKAISNIINALATDEAYKYIDSKYFINAIKVIELLLKSKNPKQNSEILAYKIIIINKSITMAYKLQLDATFANIVINIEGLQKTIDHLYTINKGNLNITDKLATALKGNAHRKVVELIENAQSNREKAITTALIQGHRQNKTSICKLPTELLIFTKSLVSGQKIKEINNEFQQEMDIQKKG